MTISQQDVGESSRQFTFTYVGDGTYTSGGTEVGDGLVWGGLELGDQSTQVSNTLEGSASSVTMDVIFYFNSGGNNYINGFLSLGSNQWTITGGSFTIEVANRDYQIPAAPLETLAIGNYVGTSSALVPVAVPEPSTYALIFGLAACGLVAYCRRKIR